MLCFPKLISYFPMPLFPLPGATFPSSRAQNRGFCALIQGNMASGSRKARKFFLRAFKLLLPVGNCRQSTWAPGTGAPGHRETVELWNPGHLGSLEPWNCLRGNCSS